MPDRLSDPQIEENLKTLKGWTKMPNRHAIEKAFKFKDFNHAWGVMSRIALLAEKMDHHPEWSNLYNRVEIILTTHDANGISEKDITMAKAIDTITKQL